ncbi:MAG: RNA polymerase sigma factor [Planctomycetota bacterium]
MQKETPIQPEGLTIARLQTGDITALASIYELFGLRVHRLCRRMLSNEHDAQDVTQEIFLRVYEQAGKFSGKSRFSTWLYRLAINHCLNRIKQRDRRSVTESAAAEHQVTIRLAAIDSPAPGFDHADAVEQVDQLLSRLFPDYRACIVLREIQGLSYTEIAELLEIPIGTVMSRLARARSQLQGILEKT